MYIEKIKVDGKVFNIFSSNTMNGLTAVVQAEALEEIHAAFDNVKTVVLYNNIGQVKETISGTLRLAAITENMDYYIDDDNVSKTAYTVVLKEVSLAEQLNAIKEKFEPVNEASMSLAEFQTYKIQQSKEALEKYLEDHPLVATIHNNTEETYSITKEKQDLMIQQYLSYQIAKQVDPEHAVLSWNATKEVCSVWTEEEFIQLVILVKQTVYKLVAAQQAWEKNIMECYDKAVLTQMKFDYASADPRNAAREEVAETEEPTEE